MRSGGKIAPLIPEHKTNHPLGRHRKRVDNRAALDAIFFVLRPGCQWNALNATQICSSSSAHLRWQAQKTGRNPTDRGKQGVKRSLMTDANGLPLSVVITSANTHDIEQVADTLDGLQTGKPGQRLWLCLDKGYDAPWLEDYLKTHRYEPHIQSRKDESEAIKTTSFKAHHHYSMRNP